MNYPCPSNLCNIPGFSTLLIDIHRRLIKEYRIKTNAQPSVPPAAETGRVLPRSVTDSTVATMPAVITPDRRVRKKLKQRLVE